MQKKKYLLLALLLISVIFLFYLSIFGDEPKKKALIGDGWRLELTDALLTKEVGNVVTGGFYALPGKSILVLYFNVKYIRGAKPSASIENIMMKKAVILDAKTRMAVTCPRIEKIRSSFSTRREEATDSETHYAASPSMATMTKKGQVTKISYTACVEENNKNLLFVIPDVGKLELETLIQERESLWQGPRPASLSHAERLKD
jgi:hypothetical protein